MARNDRDPRDTDDEQQDENSSASGNKKKLLLMVLAGLLLVSVSVGGTLFAVKLLRSPLPLSDESTEADEPALKPAIYYPMKPAILVNYSVRGRQRYLQAELTLMTREVDVLPAIELHQPMIRNALVLLMGGQIFSELQTAEGKELLRQQCLQQVQRLLEQEIGKPGVEQVLFTSFVIQ